MASKSKAKASKKPAAAKPSPSAPKSKRAITVAGQPTLWIREIDQSRVVKRRSMGDIAGLARSIDQRGCLLHPVAVCLINEVNYLIAGQRRLAAWALSKFRREPIPVHIVSIDDILAGEVDENKHRKDFTPSESVALMQAGLARAKEIAQERMRAGKKTPDAETGSAKELLARYAGISRPTLEKAEKIVAAAEADPDKFGPLREQMDATNKVNGAFKRLQIMQKVAAIKTDPPQLPGNGPYSVVVIDFPWPGEIDAEQESIDARGRSFRPYPEMAINAGLKFMANKVAPLLAPDVVLYFWVTNHHIFEAEKLIKAAGLGQHSTMLTWPKQHFGHGQILRDQTEHCIIVKRGNPTINIFGEDPPTTLLPVSARRENSRKPDDFYALVERLTPAKRYAEFFSTGGHGEAWDCFGDQAQRFEAAAPAADAHSDTHNPAPELATEPELTALQALEAIEAGRDLDIKAPIVATLKAEKLVRGSVKLKLTKLGMVRLEALRKEEYSKFDDAAPPDRGAGDRVEENSIPQVDCRVCSEGTGLCAECIAAGDHLITTGFDLAAEPIEFVADCSCGFRCQAVYDDAGEDPAADIYPEPPAVTAAVKAHLQNVVTEANAASASVAQSDPLDIPACLRRAPAEAAE